VSVSTERKNQRQDHAWAIAVGGIVAVSFAALLVFAWEFAATLFLIFSGILLGVALTAMTNLLKKVMPGPHAARLVVICVLLAAMMAGIFTLGGSTIAQQATALSGTIKSQIVNLKTFLESYGFDASYLDFNTISATAPRSSTVPATTPTLPNVQHNLPSAGAIASGGGAIVSQTLKVILGTVGAVGNFFIVLFLGLAFAAQPGIYRKGLIAMSPRAIRPQMETVIDRIGSTLERWLIAQMITMTAVFVVTWLGFW